MIDNEIHGEIMPDQVPALLKKYLKKAKETSATRAMPSL